MNKIRSEAQANWLLQENAQKVLPTWQKRGIIRQYAKKPTFFQTLLQLLTK